MKLLLILSVVSIASAVRVPNAWPTQSYQNPNLNDVNSNNQQIRQVPNYNGINPFINNVPNIPSAGLITQGNIFANLPVDYNWFPQETPQNGFGFIAPPNQIGRGNLINNNINQATPYPQANPNAPAAAQRNYNRNPDTSARPDSNPNRQVEGQVPYITFTTQRSVPQAAAFNTKHPTQGAGRRENLNQAYPQANPTTVPITELDFSPLDPFPHSQLDSQASTQVSDHNNIFNTPQPLQNFDFHLNDPFSQIPQINNYQGTQYPQRNGQIPFNKPLLAVTDYYKPRHNPGTTAKNLDFDPFKKNYRDHRTHEPTGYDPNYDNGAGPIPKRLQTEKAPIVSNHEHPAEVPTRPIYPGEAQWAKPGVKHRPFISKQQYKNLDNSNEQVDGDDTFLEAQKLFEKQQQQFGLKSKQLSKEHNSPPEVSSPKSNDEDIFVPTRLYAQVRHTEDEKHLPPQTDTNGRLKELVKDSKVQTIYSEEGFEDSAYDHAGHEKKAENIEGIETDEKNKEAKAKKRIPVKKVDRQSSSYAIGDQDLKEEDIDKLKKEELNLEDDNEENDDSEPAGTHYDEQSYLNKIDPKNDAIIKSKNIKVVTAKDKGGGKIEMEISSEVKAVRQPNNSTKIHKYVKIYPKINKNVAIADNTTENEIPTADQEKNAELGADRRSLTVGPNEIFIEEIINQTNAISSEQYISTTVAPTEYSEIVTMEIPATTQSTTSIPKSAVEDDESIENTDNNESHSESRRRRKRSSDGIPEIEVDTDFIDEINHDLGKPTEKSNKQDEAKYPYYSNPELKGIHQDSALRYSEDLKNVPKKTEGKLAFYDLADRKMECADVNPEVDPVPDRIKNADESVEDEEEDEEGNDPATKEPRLGQLGDKIDCFKAKYFGEDPLDNPIFKEELVGPVQPIFSEIESISKKKIETAPIITVTKKEPLHTAASSFNTNNEIEDISPHKHGLKSWFPGKGFSLGENTERDSKFVNHFVERNPHLNINVALLSQQSKGANNDGSDIKAQNSKQSAKEVQTPPTLITTPKYSIDLKPKHIYDQIQLLEYLPEEEFEEIRKAIEADLPKINKTDITTPSPHTNKTETVLSSPLTKKRKDDKKNAERRMKMLKINEESMRMETSDDNRPQSVPEVDALQLVRKKPRKPLFEIFDVNKFIPKIPGVSPTRPNYLAPVSIKNPTYQIFDINKYLPTTPFPMFNNILAKSTVLPKYKVFSEVFYKDDIKPNEQLNVFTDVLKHIGSFPKDSFSESSEPISVKLDTKEISEKFPQNVFEQAQDMNNNYFSSTITNLLTTFDPKVYASNHRYPQTENPLSADNMLNGYRSSKRPKRRRRPKTTTQETPLIIEESTSTIQYIGEPAEVMGLMPPIIEGYKTIYHPKRDSSQHISNPTIMIEEKKINKYFVQGMRPPPKQRIVLYSDFLTDNHILQRMTKHKRNILRRRSKRNAQRPAYAQVARTKTEAAPEDKKEAVDDYVPQRTRNYHYDEKTGKIVYDKKPEQPSEEEEEVVYIEVVDETPKTTEKPKQNPIFATATPPPAGQSYTDFVKLLKSASNYHAIPDPTTTERGAEVVTQKIVTSTVAPAATQPPAFLTILAKVRNDSNYKIIEDKKKTTTAKPIEVEEEPVAEEESQVDDVRNSPGGYEGQKELEAGANLEIFDITDYLPNIKSYLPKTAVDTSKYKTIERPNVRHSLSSRYNSENEKNLQNVNTNKQPIFEQGQVQAPEVTPQRQQGQVQTPEVTSHRPRLQRRRTTTTPRSFIVQDIVDTTTSDESEVPNETTKRRRRRRRRKRIKLVPSVEEEGVDTSAGTTKKVVRRRSERESHLFAEGNERYEQVLENDGTVAELPISTEDYVDFEDITENSNDTNTNKDEEDITEITEKIVDVFKNYDKEKKHGGNYKKEDEVNKTITVVTPELEEKTKKPVEIFKEYDKQKKHGGNYKKEDEVNKTITVVAPGLEEKTKKSVEIFKEYDKQKKHGGNYKKEDEVNKTITVTVPEIKNVTIKPVEVFRTSGKQNMHDVNDKVEKEDIVNAKEQLKPVVNETDPKNIKKVEVFKKYDKSKKHGGNYRPESENGNVNEQDESGLERTASASIQIANVNVFQDFDKTKKHGGNYKSEDDALKEPKANIELEKLKDVEVIKDYDKTKKHGGNYKPAEGVVVVEETLEKSQLRPPQNVIIDESNKNGSVEVFKEYDKTKLHGGNYKHENHSLDDQIANIELDILKDLENKNVSEEDEKTSASIQIANVNVFQDYDKTKKHGGNYKSEDDGFKDTKANMDLKTLKDVEVIKDYDKTKKHGGNYKTENIIVVPEQEQEESQLGPPQRQNVLTDESDKKGSVEIFKDYDKTKKHGGNYMRENDTIEKGEVEKNQETGTAKDIEVFQKYNEEPMTGGNYKREDELELKADETHITNVRVPQTTRYVESRNDVQRLADVVLKPEAFYTDFKLPLDINALKIVEDLPNEELEEIVKSEEVDKGISKEQNIRRNDKAENVVIIRNKIRAPLLIETPTTTTTKKPLFIKDPSKRLYFYAPLR